MHMSDNNKARRQDKGGGWEVPIYSVRVLKVAFERRCDKEVRRQAMQVSEERIF